MVVGMDDSITHLAASGSCQTLNSALVVTFPPLAEPPMKIICSICAATSGYTVRSIATFVLGASVTKLTRSVQPMIA